MNAPERLVLKIALPSTAGRIEGYDLRAPRAFPNRSPRAFTRIAHAAAHVVADALAATEPWLEAAVDWDATIAYRHHLWSLGLGSISPRRSVLPTRRGCCAIPNWLAPACARCSPCMALPAD